MSYRYFKFQIAVLVILILSILILFGGIILWERLFPLPYRIAQPVTQPASVPADIAELTARVENLENDQNFNLKALEWKIDQKLIILGGIAALISLAAGVIGVKSYNDLDKVINEEVRRSLDEALYQRDVLNRNIWLLTDEKTSTDMEVILNRLELSGLTYVTPIENLDKRSYKGITILPIFNEEMENQFTNYLDRNRNKLSDRKAAFILYAPSYRVKQATFDRFANMTAANMPVTAVSHVLTVERGLIDDTARNRKEESK